MHTVDLIAKHVLNNEEHKPIESAGKQLCAVTGYIVPCVKRNKAISKDFTTQSVLKAPYSEYVSVNAFLALKYKWERMSSWIVSEDGFIKLKRPDIRKYVFNKPIYKTWSGYVTTSYKKHGALFTPINTNDKAIWLFETKLVNCTDIDKVKEWYTVLDDAIRNGISRPIIESLNPASYAIVKIGIDRWMKFEEWAKPKYKSSLYRFLTYLLPSQEELKNETT